MTFSESAKAPKVAKYGAAKRPISQSTGTEGCWRITHEFYDENTKERGRATNESDESFESMVESIIPDGYEKHDEDKVEMTPVERNIGQLLVDNGQITAEELDLAETERKKTGESIKTVLSRLGLASEKLLKNTLELEYGTSYLSIANVQLLPQVVNLVPESVVREYHVLPIAKDGNRITVAMVNPSDSSALEKIKEHLNGLKLKPVVCLEDDFIELVKNHYGSQAGSIISGDEKPTEKRRFATLGNKDIHQLADLIDIKEDASEAELLKYAQDEGVILVADQILSGAIKKGASNIHINCQGENVVISYRVSGVLSVEHLLPKRAHRAITLRYRFMTKQNIVERQLLQDGHIRIKFGGRDIFCRISFIPTSEGEHIVIWIG